MAKKKSEEYYQKKIDKIKDEKRALGHIPASLYGKITNKDIKRVKDGLAAARRAVKHSENFEIKKQIDQEVENFNKQRKK